MSQQMLTRLPKTSNFEFFFENVRKNLKIKQM